MFQNVNATNSALFALLSKYQKSVYPPKVLKMAPPFLQITRNSPTIFRFEQREVEPSKFTANYSKIAQFATPSHESREFRAILVKFYKSLLPNCTPTFYSKIPRNSLTSQRFRAIDAKLTYFAPIPTNLLFYFSDSRKTGFSTLLARITRIPQH